jgi:hypothetical protein
MQDKAEKRKRDDGDEREVRHAFQRAGTFHSLKFILFPVPTFHNHIYVLDSCFRLVGKFVENFLAFPKHSRTLSNCRYRKHHTMISPLNIQRSSSARMKV